MPRQGSKAGSANPYNYYLNYKVYKYIVKDGESILYGRIYSNNSYYIQYSEFCVAISSIVIYIIISINIIQLKAQLMKYLIIKLDLNSKSCDENPVKSINVEEKKTIILRIEER